MSASGVEALIAELARARALGENPATTALWLKAPQALRLQFADGFIDAQMFWDALTRWFAFEERAP